jgi:DNA primase
MDFARQLKDRIDIVQVISERIRLQKTGATYKARCPFHNEKTPSFNVNPSRQMFRCFGCGKGGSVLDFVMEIDGLTFWEACVQLAEHHGIPLPKRTDPADNTTRIRAGAFEAHDIAMRLYRETLLGPAGAQARDYLKKRGVTQAIADEFGLGLSERGGQTLLRQLERAGITGDALEETGLILKREAGGHYDRFRNRLMFPIHNETGKLIGFGGRAIEAGDEPKYLNSPETAIYHKSQVLYNLHRARKPARAADAVVLVEGYMDVIGLAAARVDNAVASCGTALTTQQARLMKRHSENVVVNFDPDRAGVNAAHKSIEVFLEEGMRIRVLSLEGGLDPDEYVAEHGAAGYQAALAKAPRYFHWLADQARLRFDMSSAEGKVEGLRFLRAPLEKITDRLERATTAQDLAAYFGIDAALVLEQVRKRGGDRTASAAPPDPRAALPDTERILIRCLIQSAEVRRDLRDRLMDLLQTEVSPLKAGALFHAVLQAGEPPDWQAAEARLETEDRHLLHLLLFADEDTGANEGEFELDQAEACMQKLSRLAHESQVAALKTRIREAERAGNLEEVMRLATELTRLGRSIARGDSGK